MKNIKIIAFIICFIALHIGVNAQILTPNENKKGKWGYVNEKGKAVIKYKYDEAREFSEGLAAVKHKGLFGYIDETGKVVIPLEYDDATLFSEGVAIVKKATDFRYGKRSSLRWGLIDKTGKAITDFKYTEIGSFSEGLAKAKDDNHNWGIIDKTGKEIIPVRYREIGNFSDGLIKVKYNNWRFIDKTGNEVFQLDDNGQVTDFSNGYAGRSYWNGWKVIDKTGKVVLPNIYSEGEVLKIISEQGLVQKEIQRIQEEAQKEKQRKAQEAQRKQKEEETLIAEAETALDNDFYSADCPSVDVLENLRKQLEQLEKSIPNGLENMKKRTYLLQLQTGLSNAMRTQLLTPKYGATSARKIMAGKYEIGMSQAVAEEIMGVNKALYKQSITTVAGQKKEIWQFDYDNPALRGYSAAVINAAKAECPTLIFKSGKLTDILR
ncbi:hypothetical protein D0T49_12680 [Paludibacter sp. 221]|uniref:WG repeat-containing protein n=1 Tax=Paludibacter sp. 221 TaxID=2302939 RepID=UPI0013D3A841|nr:WG repeat-containing protein [Paludibacter sp. 221]NDV47902.1 hypothetical protein [Paludibacter sp. 221]